MKALYGLQIIVIIFGIHSFYLGVKNFKKIKGEKPLIFIPFFSVIQIVLSELTHIAFDGKVHIDEIQYLWVNLYVSIELLLISLFLRNIAVFKLEKFTSSVLIALILFSVFIENIVLKPKLMFEINSLKLIEIGIIIPYSIYIISKFISRSNEIYFFKNPTIISLFVIFITRIILGPIISLEKYLINDSSKTFAILFSTSSLTYIFIFISLSYVFRISGKQ